MRPRSIKIPPNSCEGRFQFEIPAMPQNPLISWVAIGLAAQPRADRGGKNSRLRKPHRSGPKIFPPPQAASIGAKRIPASASPIDRGQKHSRLQRPHHPPAACDRGIFSISGMNSGAGID
jgi:hypothetical protein